ncbi:hypothetical protein FA95DRAFT_1554195 [Auriscalpium vulgare]|uniref:Uncharacterized protein n=1 Tax=Auriscalpium vulgare TaxID=40419 RepID=A0ACB8S664_9AGAM|nr:hypothetical protein FA95DRAFT_1554195 [Auriscalpium vulgare]
MAQRQPSPSAPASTPGPFPALTRVLSFESDQTAVEPDAASPASSTTNLLGERSVFRARGREFRSSGRGGAGNIRHAASREPTRTTRSDGPDDFSPTPGRELRSPFSSQQVISTGRGGAGNIRFPSRNFPSNVEGAFQGSQVLQTNQAIPEDALIRQSEARAAIHSTGRGGAGNMNRSRPHPLVSAEPPSTRGSGNAAEAAKTGAVDKFVRPTGRGGTGNIKKPASSPSGGGI